MPATIVADNALKLPIFNPNNFSIPEQLPSTVEHQEILEEFKNRKPWQKFASDEWSQIDAQSSPNGHGFDDLENVQHPPEEEHKYDNDYWMKEFSSFCDDACLLRYLRANGFDIDKAHKQLGATLLWRRKYRPHVIHPEEVKHVNERGQSYINGFTKQGNPIVYFRPHLNALRSERDWQKEVRFLVFNIETAIRLMPAGQERVVLIFDFAQYSRSTSVPLHVSHYFLHLFATCYPERLQKIFACDAPWFFWMFYKIISPFIQPVTKAKIRFVDVNSQSSIENEEQESSNIWSNILLHVDDEMLEKRFGGSNKFSFEHDSYWTSLQNHLGLN